MIKDRIITFLLILIIVILLVIIGFFGFKIVVQGYSFDQVIDYIRNIPQGAEDSSDEQDQVETENNNTSENITNGVIDNEVLTPAVPNENSVDLTALKNYTGTEVGYELTRELMLLVISDYQTYITDVASDGDVIAIEFSRNANQDDIETYVSVINSYIAELEAEQTKGSFNISFSVGQNGNEILTIDRNNVLETVN